MSAALARRRPRHGAAPRRPSGFTLLELALVLVVIGLIAAAVSSSADVLRQAQAQRAFSEFVVGWQGSFSAYVSRLKALPGDNASQPTGRIGGASGLPMLCNDNAGPALSNAFLANGIGLPGNGLPGMEDRLRYQDRTGTPHELQVCLATMDWAVPGASVGQWAVTPRHVMVLRGLTVELARQFDVMMDGRPDARMGRMRSAALAAATSTTSAEWPDVPTDTEENIPEIEALIELN